MSKRVNILITGSEGQVGKELTPRLKEIYGAKQVFCADIKIPEKTSGQYIQLDILDKDKLHSLIERYQINEVYHLAALLSATAEKKIQQAWHTNMQGLINILELGRDKIINKIFWPSSIAVFGPHSPKINTPQLTVAEPSTIYGITKVAGESLCNYYYSHFNVDVRSVRYPGLIGAKSLPGGGTTDYAVHIFHHALTKGKYSCFLKSDTRLPMMYLDDAIRATIEIMQTESANVKIRTSYNIAGISFSPAELAAEIKKHIKDFTIQYKPDFRQKIAENWPESIDDSMAAKDWRWKKRYNLSELVNTMLSHLREYSDFGEV